MRQDRVLENVYENFTNSNYSTCDGLQRIIGFIRLVAEDFDDKSIQSYTHMAAEGVCFRSNTKEDYTVVCIEAPDFENKDLLFDWVKKELRLIEDHFTINLFQEIRHNSRVQGKKT